MSLMRTIAICLLSTLFFACQSARAGATEDGVRQAMQSTMVAIAKQDVQALTSLMDVPSEKDRPYVEAVAKMLVAGRRLADAATAKFGSAGDAIGKGPIAVGDEKDIPNAAVTVKDDVAELVMPGHTFPLRFRQVNGTWKFKAIDFGGSQPRDFEKQTILTDMFTSALAEAALEIEQGRYAQSADAEAAIRQKLNQVLMKSLAPTTQPAKGSEQ